ncbi:MAG: hypothetical protein Q9160_006571 [Pyrenula sp. 1 TL-2023]
MSSTDIGSIKAYGELIKTLLERANEVKQVTTVDPTLTETDLGSHFDNVRSEIKNGKETSQAIYASLETVFRQQFYKLVATFPIDDPAFVQTWNLLDIVSMFGDHELCEPGLLFWLAEELLDSQTIDGCRNVFDYLESRRERITAKHFKSKSLIILRACNELLRRLSRAEDTVFCGRVFIFLFQSFPLGDKSSVNLRGEFHIENVTTFDETLTTDANGAGNGMDVDGVNPKEPSVGENGEIQVHLAAETEKPDEGKSPRSNDLHSKSSDKSKALDLDRLYPIFWGLQTFFSCPTQLFNIDKLASFKTDLDLTVSSFQSVKSSVAASLKISDDTKRGLKRKRTGAETEAANTFHPKYLTNKDLFELEINDLAFRRHILVQALILLDFLLSLTPTAKLKLNGLTNKSVHYNYTLSDEDETWVRKTKDRIAEYLQQGVGNEGKFYYRMVDTVLSRDKNWARWKAENCPPIERPPITVEQYTNAQDMLKKLCVKPFLKTPMDAIDMSFLSRDSTLSSLKDPERYSMPSIQSFHRAIENDELDAEMGTAEEKQAAREAKEGKLWRALRASSERFRLCEKIENGKNLKALLGENVESEEMLIPPAEDLDGGAAEDG